MRKIERELVQALIDRRVWRKDNTSVEVYDLASGDGHCCTVRLYGHPIAKYYDDGTLWVSNAGYRTTTTKSRLNAVLKFFRHSYGVYQSQFNWFLVDDEGEHEFDHNGWHCVA